MSAMGRPKKLKENRTAYTFYLNDAVREAMDEYVNQVKRERKDYSRSDFFNEAATLYLETVRKKGGK